MNHKGKTFMDFQVLEDMHKGSVVREYEEEGGGNNSEGIKSR